MSVPAGGVGALPIRLRNFFARYPPQTYSAMVAPQPNLPQDTEATEASAEKSLPSPYTPNRDAKGNQKPDVEKYAYSRSLLHNDPEAPNPFLPQKIPRTGKWKAPRYGLRQQADLVKMASKYNVEPLLPPGIKSTIYKAARLAERGLAVKGTGIGQKVKGHKWERTMEARLEDRRKAMLEMPEMIRLWKQVSSHESGMISIAVTNVISFREVMVVDGANGPSGKYKKHCLANFHCVPSTATPAYRSFAIYQDQFAVGSSPPSDQHLYEHYRGSSDGVIILHLAISSYVSYYSNINYFKSAIRSVICYFPRAE